MEKHGTILLLVSVLVVSLLLTGLVIAKNEFALNCEDKALNLTQDQYSSFQIEDSVYGDPHNLHLQCTFFDRNVSYAGWFWGKPFWSAKPYFPNVVFRPLSTGQEAPLSQISQFDIGIGASVNGVGRYNLILDIWFTNESRVTSDELMVFLLRHGQGMDTREFMSDGYNMYSYYTFKPDPIRIHLFAVVGSQIPQEVNIRAMLDHMAAKGYRPTYLLKVQLGDEIFQGVGATTITEFAVTLNGHLSAFNERGSNAVLSNTGPATIGFENILFSQCSDRKISSVSLLEPCDSGHE